MAVGKILYLDGVRGAAAFSVFVCHFLQAFLPHIYYVNKAESHGLFEESFAESPFNIVVNGNFAVCLFFVLSGYVLSHRFFDDGGVGRIQKAAAKRYFRLALPTLASLVFAWAILALNGYHYGEARLISKSGMADNYTVYKPFLDVVYQGLIGVFFRNDWALNPVLWTMQTELIGSFLIFSIILLVGGLRYRSAVILILAVIFFNGYYLAFILGILLASLAPHRSAGLVPLPLALAVLLLGFYFGSYPYYGADEGIWRGLPTFGVSKKAPFYHILGAFFIILAISWSRRLRRLLELSLFRFFGRISYSLYLIHFPLVCSVGSWLLLYGVGLFSYPVAVLCSFAGLAPVVIGLAYLFTVLIDEPMIAVADRLGNFLMVRTAGPGKEGS